MNTERWLEIAHVFDMLSELPLEERGPALARECGSDVELRREVEALLASAGEDDAVLDQAVQGTAESLARVSSTAVVGRRVGPYRIKAMIGRGGMGTVYEAVRDDDEFQKRVALKLVRSGLETEADIRRFRRERQILARLEHPSIARLIDGGSTEEGLPYLVMEFVEGVPITSYCVDHALSLAQRLELFQKVCAAVQYAHQNLVVHRDIKPANILVNVDRTPKLLDFGVAKLLDAETAESTHTSAWMMTPDYASPEQLRGEPVTAASDVYSLGGVLRRVLAGEPLPADLENIVQMALRPEPARRYSTVEQFSEDLRRYLEGRPVVAQKDTLRYRAAKFVRRNRLGLAAATAVVASLTAGVSIAYVQARRVERRYEQARNVTRTLILGLNNRLKTLPTSLASWSFLVNTGEQYLNSLAMDAEGDDHLLWELAKAYRRIGDLQSGSLPDATGKWTDPRAAEFAELQKQRLGNYRKAFAILEKLSRRQPANREVRIALAEVGGSSATVSSTLEERIKMLQQALRLASEGKSLDDPQLSAAIQPIVGSLGAAQITAGDPHAALTTLRSLEALSPKSGYSLELGLLAAQERAALSYMGDFEGAVASRLRIIDLIERELSTNAQPPVTYIVQLIGNELGVAASLGASRLPTFLGRPEEAMRHHQRAFQLTKQIAARAGYEHDAKQALGQCYFTLAEILEGHNPARAVEAYYKAYEYQPMLRGNGAIAYALRALGKREEARKELENALSRSENDRWHGELGDLLGEMGDRQAALRHLSRAVELAEKELKNTPKMMHRRSALADAYSYLGKFHTGQDNAKARAWYGMSLDIWREWAKWGVSSAFNERKEREVSAALAKLDQK